jgi:hypothetical protein
MNFRQNLFLGFVILAAAFIFNGFSQEGWGGGNGGGNRGGNGGGNGGRMGGGMGKDNQPRNMRPQNFMQPRFEICAEGIYILVPGKLYRLDKDTLKILKEKELMGEEPEENNENVERMQKIEKLFKKLDKNNDGKISKDEWDVGLDKFKQLDKNNDGFVSVEEIKSNISNMNKRPLMGEIKIFDKKIYLLSGNIMHLIDIETLEIKASNKIPFNFGENKPPFDMGPKDRENGPEDKKEPPKENKEFE